MVLAKSIKAHDGSILAAEAEPLTDVVIKRLGMTGLTHIVVQGKPLPGYGMGYDVQARYTRVQYLFRSHQENTFMKSVCVFLRRHFEDRL